MCEGGGGEMLLLMELVLSWVQRSNGAGIHKNLFVQSQILCIERIAVFDLAQVRAPGDSLT
jgi:hypothetical protein